MKFDSREDGKRKRFVSTPSNITPGQEDDDESRCFYDGGSVYVLRLRLQKLYAWTWNRINKRSTRRGVIVLIIMSPLDIAFILLHY